VLAVVLIIVANVFVTAVFNKYPWNIDLTENKVFELSPETKQFLSSLDTDLDIVVLNTEAAFIASAPSEYFNQANEIIRKYAQLSPRVHLSYVDLLRNPDFASQYSSLVLHVNDILVSTKERSRSLTPEDLFNIRSSYYGSYIASSKAEQSITRTILMTVSDERLRVSILSGHNEEDISPFIELLAMNNYEVALQNLLTSEIASDTAFAILAAPARDLSTEELRKLDRFLAGGDNKTLFYLASASQSHLPNLAAFLAEWGITVDEGVVFEQDSSRILSNSVYIAILDYAEQEFSKASTDRNLPMVIPNARPLRALFETSGYKTVSELLRFSAQSGIRPAHTGSDWRPSGADMSPHVPVLLLSQSVRNGLQSSLLHSNLLACGSTLALNQSILASPNLANASYFLDIFSALSRREQLIRIEDKTLGASELGATVDQVMVISIVFAGVLPLVLLIIGSVVWLRRRSL
jgi:hypothetical protein